jgi:hypothetical protein
MSKDPSRPFQEKAFDNIECMTLERKFQLFVASDHHKKYQLANLGKFTVDFKHMKLFVTAHPTNASLYNLVKRGVNHVRPRPDDNDKFSQAILTYRDGMDGDYDINFLGKAWGKKHKGDKWAYPSMKEIFDGIMMEAKEQLRLTSGCPVGSQMLKDAQDNICETWELLLDLVDPKNPTLVFKMKNLFKNKFDRNTPLTYEILDNPRHPATILLLRLYTIECFLYVTLNNGCRFADSSKVDTLGPYAQALNEIVRRAGDNRKDIKSKNLKGMDLYRGSSMTEDQI